jgi:predicted methyltransferase
MAKVKKVKEAKASNPETAKYNSAGKKRSTAALKGTEKGSIIRIVRGAISLTNQTVGDKKEAKKLAGRMNSAVKPGGKIDMLDESSEAYTGLKAAARKALPSLQAAKYDDNVSGLLQYITDTLSGGSGGGGRKGFNPGALADISL